MASTIIQTQDSMQNPTSSSSAPPRFRPYASAKHHVTKGRYITSNDPRGYIPVYEYPLNGQWIMMDIDDGYILWTGIWKALGNSKADIVKMIDSQPDLAPLIRRVRGGYLKIQGTWMPYEVALRLSRRVAWTIREDLIPLFGPTFPSTCLSPDQPGYGQVVASGNGRRRARRTTQSSMIKGASEAQSWTVVTPGSQRSPIPHQSPPHHYSQYPPPSSYNPPHPAHPQHPLPHPHRSSVPPESPSPSLRGSHSHEHMQSHRYSPYMGHNKSPKGSLSLDIPPRSSHGQHGPRPGGESITLPPLRTPGDNAASDGQYALPPISALEDLRGVNTSDSAAVLRRLKLDDDDFAMDTGSSSIPSASSAHYRYGSSTSRRHSLNAHAPYPSDSRSPHMHALSRSYQERRRSPSIAGAYGHGHALRRSQSGYLAPSDASHEGDSTGGTSPITPTTPQSSYSGRESSVGIPSYAPSRDSRITGMFATDKLASSLLMNDAVRGVEKRVYSSSSATRRSPYDADSDSDSNSVHPHRPW